MCYGKPIACDLTNQYLHQINQLLETVKSTLNEDKNVIMNELDTGLRLGTFLSEAGWMNESIQILSCLLPLIDILDINQSTLILKLDCYQRLLHAQANFCCFKEASITIKNAMTIVNQLSTENIPNSLLANLYIQISHLHFLRSEYDLSYNWSTKALKRLRDDIPDK